MSFEQLNGLELWALQTPTQVEELKNVGNDYMVTVYPNPANDKLNIQLQNGSGVFELYDITGRKHQTVILSGVKNLYTISTAQLSQGIYIYKFTDKEGRMVRGKIVVASE